MDVYGNESILYMKYTISSRLPHLFIILSIVFLLTSCHVVRYEMEFPDYDQPVYKVERKRSAFPPDSVWRDLTFCKVYGKYRPWFTKGFSIYQGDTLFHNNDMDAAIVIIDTSEAAWKHVTIDTAVDVCRCQLKEIKRNR